MLNSVRNIGRYFCHNGMAVRGRCSKDEASLITGVWEQVRRNIDHAKEGTIWVNMFLNDKFLVEETPEILRLHAWATELIRRDRKHYFLHQIGFFFSASHSTHEQEFHIDYHPQAETWFVPLVPVSTLNSTRYMTTPSTSEPTPGRYYSNRYGKDDFDLLEREGRDHIEIAQIVCREFTILHLLSNTVHRGIRNSSDYDRPMFFAFATPDEDFFVKEKSVESDVNIPKRPDE